MLYIQSDNYNAKNAMQLMQCDRCSEMSVM